MKNNSFIISTVISITFAIVPFVVIFFLSIGNYPKIPVEIMDDSNYYYSRAVEISEGNFFAGNQYIEENKNELSPSFFVGDWLWSTPLILGLSIQSSIVLNQILWFLFFGVLLYCIFLFFGMEKKYIPWAISFVFLFIYWYLARPVAMQIIYPIFLMWLVSLVMYLREPDSKRNLLLLFLSSTVSVYVYTYLAQIIFVTFFVLLFSTFFQPFKKYRYLWFVSVAVFMASVPFIYYSFKQIGHPLYFETFYRIGLVNTHMIGTPALIYSLVLMIGLSLLYLFRNRFLHHELIMIYSVSFGLFLATVSNVFTGKDLEIAVHVGRFVELWSVILLCLFVQKNCDDFKNWNCYKIITFGIYVLFVISFFMFQLRVWTNVNGGLLDNEVYYAPLEWLKDNTPEDSVILANDNFSSYVPVMTHNYVLFHPNALLQIDKDENIKNRYLASRIFENLNREDIKRDMRKYAGAGYTAHRHMVHNRSVRLCQILHLNLLGKDCGQFETQYTLVGEKYFSDMEEQFGVFKKDKLKTLKNYNVSYVVFDKLKDDWFLPKGLKPVWTNGRFEIYEVS